MFIVKEKIMFAKQVWDTMPLQVTLEWECEKVDVEIPWTAGGRKRVCEYIFKDSDFDDLRQFYSDEEGAWDEPDFSLSVNSVFWAVFL